MGGENALEGRLIAGAEVRRSRGDFLLDQTPVFDRGPRATHVAWGEGPSDAEPEPDLHFDQSLPPGFDV